MLHVDSQDDEIYLTEFPTASVPKSLRSFVIRNSENIQVSPFLMELFAGLQCLTLGFRHSDPPRFSFLSHCSNLVTLKLYHNGRVDFSFLRSLPQLKYLAEFSSRGIRVEDAVLISRDAPNLESLTLLLSHTDSSRDYFESIGRELLYVKTLMFYGDKIRFKAFLEVFLANPSLFRQVTSLRCVFREDDTEVLNFSNSSRPQCLISQHTMFAKLNDHWCLVCWERKTPNWTCPRCNGFVFSLR